jgi:hypothetical protein
MSSVSGISTAQKASALGRVAARQVGRSRWLRAGWSAVFDTLGSLARVLRLLWLEVAGVFFVAFALIGSLAFVREYRVWMAGTSGPGRALLALAFTVLFAYFGVTSFWRVRRRS